MSQSLGSAQSTPVPIDISQWGQMGNLASFSSTVGNHGSQSCMRSQKDFKRSLPTVAQKNVTMVSCYFEIGSMQNLQEKPGHCGFHLVRFAVAFDQNLKGQVLAAIVDLVLGSE